MQLPRVLVMMALVGAAAPVVSGVNTLTDTGPDGGIAYDVEFVGGGALLATTSGGVYRAADASADWVRTATPHSRWGARQLAVNPADRNLVLLGASSSLLRSTDAGVTWTAVPNLTALATSFVSTVRFSHDGSLAWMSQQNGETIFRSTDAGLTWTPVNTGFTQAFFEFHPDPVDAQLVYARSADGVFVSSNGGQSFTAMNVGGQYVSALAASRLTASSALAMNSLDFKVYRTINGGAGWNSTAYVSPLGSNGMRFMTSVPGTAGKYLAMTASERLLQTTDDGESWSDVGPSPNGHIFSMAFDPADPAHILVATYGGVLESTNDGASWQERNRGLREGPARGIAVSHAGAGATYLVTNDLASVYRRNPDASWTPVAAAATPLLGYPASSGVNHGWYPLVAGRQDEQRLYLTREAQLGVSGDGGVNWTAHAMPLYASTLAVAGHDDNHVYAGAGNAIPARTLDGGLHWENLGSHGLPAGVRHFAFDPTNANVIYAAVDNYFPPMTNVVYKSMDGGATFNPLPWNGAHNPSIVHKLVHDPVRTNIVYLVAYHGLFKTTDGGASWTQHSLYNDVLHSGGAADLVIDPQAPEILYAAAYFDPVMSRSADGGVTWEVFATDTGEFDHTFNRLALLPGTRNRIVGTRVIGSREIDLVSRVTLATATPTTTVNTATTTTWNIANAGALTVTDLRLTATLPASSTTITAQPSAGSCAIASGVLTCALGRLAGNSQASVAVAYTPTATGNWSATASVYEVEDSAADNIAQVAVNPAAPVGGGGGGGVSMGGGGGGGGGGGSLDYLLLAALALCLTRTPLRRRFPWWAAALKKH